MMENKKGFTLIELLAVIVILALISLISLPIIINIVNKAKKSAFLDSSYGILESAKLYYTESMLEGGISEDKIFLFEGDIPKGLNYSGKSPKEGILIIKADGSISFAFHNGNYCTSKKGKENTIFISEYEEGKCSIENIAKDPVITLNGNRNIKLKQGESYIEEGATARTVDGTELTYQVEMKANGETVFHIDTTTVGMVYEVIYTAESNEKTATVIRTITIEDGIAPVITFTENPVIVKITEVNEYNIYMGVIVEDNVDGTIEANMKTVKTTGELKAEIGEYTVTYEAMDSAGNKGIGTRTFKVVSAEGPILGQNNIGSETWTQEQTITITAVDNDSDIESFTYIVTRDEEVGEIENGTRNGREAKAQIPLLETGVYYIEYTSVDGYKNSTSTKIGPFMVDVIQPEVRAKNPESETIMVGDNNIITDYFTIVSPDNYSGTRTTCTNTSDANQVVTNTDGLEIGTHTIKCTVTRGSGKSAHANQVVEVKQRCTNPPEIALSNGLIPIKWNGSSWVVADETNPSGENQWHDYCNQMWANAASVTETYRNAKAGTVLPEGSVLAYFVWIPRYEYMYTNLGTNYAGGTREQPGEIKINFIEKNVTTPSNSNYKIHPAFDFGGTKLAGIWVGKFETTGDASKPTIKPNLSSLRNQSISAQFNTAKQFSNNINTYGIHAEVDAHMMKNSEWGAVAYLSQSKYGKYGNESYIGVNKEVYQNKSENFITGCSFGAPSPVNGTDYSCQYTYEKSIEGTGASSTGTIYGVYDMSGGADEHVMGYYEWGASTWGASMYNDQQTNYAKFTEAPDRKYYEVYTTENEETACSGEICYGHALSETKFWYDSFSFVKVRYPWFRRGGFYSTTYGAGVFAAYSADGRASNYYSFRVVLLGQ